MKHLNPYDKIKVFFRNGIIIEGVLDYWTDHEALLSTDDGHFIIQDTRSDVMCVKIIGFGPKKADDLEDEYYPDLPLDNELFCSDQEQLNEIEHEVNKIKSKPIDDLSIKKLSELRKMQALEERKIIANKLKSHEIGEVKKVEYGIPGFLKK